MTPIGWVRRHDPGFVALRRAARVAVVMPAMFALAAEVIKNDDTATFAAFGSLAMLLMVDFGGDRRERVTAEIALAVTGGVGIVIGTLASRYAWLAAVVMAVVGFLVIFAGVVSSVLAAATVPLLLSYILPASLPGPASSIPSRLAGWGLAGGAAVIAIVVLWPAPKRSPLREATAPACRTMASRLRADGAYVLGGDGAPSEEERDRIASRSGEAMDRLQRQFFATPYRPTALSTDARTLVRLVDELIWLQTILVQVKLHPRGPLAPPMAAARKASCAVKSAAAEVLEECANLLEDDQAATDDLDGALDRLRQTVAGAEREAIADLPRDAGGPEAAEVARIVSSLDPGFRAQELGFGVTQIATNVQLTVAAQRRSWLDRLLGHQPEGLDGPLTAAWTRARGHVDRHSVWLHNSIRGAIGLAIAVLVANLTGVEHAFWVVLGTLSVLRSNALNTGSNALRALTGTVVGVVIGAAILAAIGTDTTVLWFVLPVALLIAAFLPAAISFAAGQAGFTLVLVILFNILAPVGWHIGVLRIEDIAIGCGVSLGVGVLLWPRGAAAALGRALCEAYEDMATYLEAAVDFGLSRTEDGVTDLPAATVRAAASARRLDDAFRSYLAERGTKSVPLAEMVALVNGVIAIRLAAGAVVSLWTDVGATGSERTAAGCELVAATSVVTDWYRRLAVSLAGDGEVPGPLPADDAANDRLVAAVGRDLEADGNAAAVAVRMIWTDDHLDAARRVQTTVELPARTATAPSRLPLGTAFPRRRLKASVATTPPAPS